MVARDPQGTLLGGILADVALGRLQVQVLCVAPAQRSTGLGAHADRFDTFDWQAERFYGRHRYAVFARLGDYPRGYECFFMSKRLA